MASLRRLPGSKFWIACYTDGEGNRRQRSTKCTGRTAAQKVAEGYETVYRRNQTETQVRQSMATIFEEMSGEALCNVTLNVWFGQWLERVKLEVKPHTMLRYGDMVKAVRRLAPAVCALMLDRVETKHVVELRAALVDSKARSTANLYLKIFRTCLKKAWQDGLIPENVAAKVSNARASDRELGGGRRPFTVEELRKIFAAADSEWRGMILAGLYTGGQRLGDIATMTAGQVDLKTLTVNFASDKTGRNVIVPIVDAWLADLRERVEGMDAATRLFPRAYGQFVAGNGTGRISNSFRRLLARCQLATKSNRARVGAVAGRRVVSVLSFHSFRHTATSMLKNAGVSDSVTRDIVGHESQAVSENYTHIDEGTKRAAMEKLPTI